MTASLTTQNDALKHYYDKQKLMDLTFDDGRVTLALLNKKEDLAGDDWEIACRLGRPENVSGTANTSFTGTDNSKFKKFVLTTKQIYNRAILENKHIEATRNSQYAFINAVKNEIDDAVKAAAKTLAIQLWRTGWGEIGRVSSLPSNSSILLTNVSDAVCFEVGQSIVFSDTLNSSVLRNSGTAVVVSNVDTSGTITFSSAINGFVSNNDYVFIAGCRENSATPSKLVLTGIPGWVPDTAPASNDSFGGVNRSVYPQRLAGSRISGAGMNMVEAVNAGCTALSIQGASADTLVLNPVDYGAFSNSLASLQNYPMTSLTPSKDGVKANVSFNAIIFNSNFGAIKVISDPFHPSGSAHLLTLKDFELGSMGAAPHISDRGGYITPIYGYDQFEVKVVGYPELGCHNTKNQCVITSFNG